MHTVLSIASCNCRTWRDEQPSVHDGVIPGIKVSKVDKSTRFHLGICLRVSLTTCAMLSNPPAPPKMVQSRITLAPFR
jgi:hypothetical protein